LMYGVLTLFLCLLGALWHLSFRDYGDLFVERKGVLASATVETVGGDSLFERSWLTIKNTDGFTVTCGFLVPRQKGRRYPVIVLLGGKATGKYAVDYALGIRNVIIVAPDYPYNPREEYTLSTFAADIPAIRQALFDMPPSVMLLIDYLLQRPDVDSTRLVMLGYSFGAPFVPCVVVEDGRFAVAAMVYGAGDMRTLIGHNVRRYEGAVAGEVVGMLAGLLLRPMEPVRFVGRVSPVPLIMINGTEDEQVPRRNVELLFEAAREPKRLVWLESRHVNPRNVDLTRKIIRTLAEELSALGVVGGDVMK